MARNNYISDVLNGVVIIKTPADAAAVTVGADSNNTAGTAIGALSIAEDLASHAYKSTIPGVTVLGASIYNNYLEANKDLNNPNNNYRIDDNTMMSLATDALSVVSILATVALAPEVAALAAISATALSLYSLTTDSSTTTSDYWLDILDKTKSMVDDFDLSDAINDLFNGTPTTAPLPGLSDFDYIDPNNPDNFDPNDGNPLNPGDGHKPPYNPNKGGMNDPLVLDTDKDGFISTISLEDSNTYFDITGDGTKEKVGWIESNDGILVYDKNNNGNIDGVDEVFGNATTSGFSELKAVADSNNDNTIDRRDELYNRLQVWHDNNGNGTVEQGELVSLKDEGVKSIELDVVGTNIDVNGNLITEAGRYQDSEGNRELAADVELEYTNRLEENPESVITDETIIDPQTKTMANLRGYGYVANAFDVYNTDEDFKKLALDFSTDISKTATNFEEYLAQWSGFYKMAESEGISKEDFTPGYLNVTSIKVWILERFAGTKVDGWRTEVHLHENTNGGFHTTTYADEAYINESFDALMKQYEGKFAIETYYKDTFSDVHYDLGIDEFVIDDEDAFYNKVATYFNSADNDIKSKLYLASVMNMQEGEFLHFDAERVLQSVTDSSLESTLSDIYDDKINFQYFKEDGYYKYDNDLIYATDADDTVTFNSKQTTTIIAGKGDDAIVDNAKGDTTYVYNLGDGSDTIYDRGGNDTLKLKDIAYEDVTITTEVADLLITINSDNSTIRVKDWMKLDNRVEHILFAGDTQVDLNDILFPKTEGDDYIEATNSDDTIDALGGNDTVKAFAGDDIITGGKGDDTLDGGSGNDTYIYNLGDGSDTIIDASGNDTLQLGSGITQDMLIAKRVGSDTVLAFKEDGKTFDELSTKITLKNNTVENIKLDDGTSVSIVDIQGNGVKFTKSNTSNLYYKVINNIYENKNKQDIMVNIFKRIA